ncbi:MAG: nucleotidyltransferase domain-containing protein [Bryobacteraceae bacterium]
MHTPLSKQEAIQEISRRLIDFYRPARIYLFGSEARGEGGPDSDLDFLVVVPDDTPASRLRPAALAQVLQGIATAADVIPWPKSDFEGRAAYVKASLPATVVREGRILYDSGTMAA